MSSTVLMMSEGKSLTVKNILKMCEGKHDDDEIILHREGEGSDNFGDMFSSIFSYGKPYNLKVKPIHEMNNLCKDSLNVIEDLRVHSAKILVEIGNLQKLFGEFDFTPNDILNILNLSYDNLDSVHNGLQRSREMCQEFLNRGKEETVQKDEQKKDTG